MEKHIETIARGVCVQDGKILLCHPKNRRYSYLPGGHIEFGETGREALIREMKEETLLDVTVGELLDVVESQFVQNGEKHCEINLIYAMALTEPRSVDEPLPTAEDWIGFSWCAANETDKMNLLPPEIKRVLPSS